MPGHSHLLIVVAACLARIASAAPATTSDGSAKAPVAGYVPSIPPAIIFACMYGLVAIVLWTHWARSAKKKYMLPLTIGMSTMTIGLAIRIYYHFSPGSLGVYCIMTLFILLSPCAYLAQNYMLLKRLSLSLSPQVACDCLLLSPTRLSKIFVWSDCLTFFFQASGGGLSAAGSKNASMANIGEKVTTVALILQLASYLAFCAILVTFGVRVARRYPRVWDDGRTTNGIGAISFVSMRPSDEWRALYVTLLLTSVGIIVRSAFRVAEFQGGYHSYLATTEAFLFTLDLLPLWLAMTCYVFVWPPRFIECDRSGQLRDDGEWSFGAAATTSNVSDAKSATPAMQMYDHGQYR